MSNFQEPPPPPLLQLRPKFFHPLGIGRPISNEPPHCLLQMITYHLKQNKILGWPYVIRSFLQFGFRFQYQLINLVWLSSDFFSFSWSFFSFSSVVEFWPANLFLRAILKNYSFSPSSYSVKIRYGQGWAEASLSTFSWLYILVCARVQKYHEMFLLKKCLFSTRFAINLLYLHNALLQSVNKLGTTTAPCMWMNETDQKENKK